MKKFPYGPCGIFCGACGAPDCGGCLSDFIDESIEQCKFRKCTAEKKIEFCCACDEYPCPELHKFMNDEWPHHWTMAPNLEFIAKNGKDVWLRAQRAEWTCGDCGAEIKWYQETCPCGRKLDAWDLPEGHKE